jgi:hypothetical protein
MTFNVNKALRPLHPRLQSRRGLNLGLPSLLTTLQSVLICIPKKSKNNLNFLNLLFVFDLG